MSPPVTGYPVGLSWRSACVSVKKDISPEKPPRMIYFQRGFGKVVQQVFQPQYIATETLSDPTISAAEIYLGQRGFQRYLSGLQKCTPGRRQPFSMALAMVCDNVNLIIINRCLSKYTLNQIYGKSVF